METDADRTGRTNQQQNYNVNIFITRHGPKTTFEGPLTEEGKAAIKEYYKSNYSIPSEPTSRKIVSSPINRAHQTAELYKETLDHYHGIKNVELLIDERLSEKNILKFINHLPHNQQDDWFRYWYTGELAPAEDVFIGKHALIDFIDWLHEEIEHGRNHAGHYQVDAFSHGPLMAAFILKLEELTGATIISTNPSEDRLNFSKLFDVQTGQLTYLKSMHLHVHSDNPDSLQFIFNQKEHTIPLNILNNFAA